MMRQIVIGCGTGRCGTVSLARLLGSQGDSRVTHEMKPTLPWIPNERSVREVLSRLETFRKAKARGPLIGDVASFYMPYLEMMLEAEPSLKVVWIYRDIEEVVASFMRKSGTRDHWHRSGRQDPQWDRCFPTYPEEVPKEAAIRWYCEEHIQRMTFLNLRYRDRFVSLRIDDLNTPHCILNMLDVPMEVRNAEIFHCNALNMPPAAVET